MIANSLSSSFPPFGSRATTSHRRPMASRPRPLRSKKATAASTYTDRRRRRRPPPSAAQCRANVSR